MTQPTVGDVKMGATLVPGGATFRVWAPAAHQVYVITGDRLVSVDTNGFRPDPDEALFSLGDGSCSAFVPGIVEGAPYRFWVNGADRVGPKRDPRARELSVTPAYPRCDCIVRDANRYPWHDGDYRTPAFNDLILYQLHVGAFYAVDAQGNDARRGIGRFLDLLDRVDYFLDLGISGIQLMPIQEFHTETSRGYNGVDLYSPEMDYQVADDQSLARYLQKANALLARHGKPLIELADIRAGQDQLKCVIDILHVCGIAVLFDLVFNHAGGGFDDQSMYFLDRQPAGDNNRSLYFTDHGWVGGLIFAYWNQDVRQFLIDNAKQCLEEYHVDGIRYDEVTVIDDNGGGRFCQDLTSTVRKQKPEAIQIAEYWAGDREAALRAAPDGLGFDAMWSDKLRSGVRDALGQMRVGRDAPVQMEPLAESLRPPPGIGAAWKVVNMLEDHDVVFFQRDERVASLAGGDRSAFYTRSRARVATGLLFASSGIPQIFMGQEFLETRQWSDDIYNHADLLISWTDLAADRSMQDFHAFTRDLIRLRRDLPALRGEHSQVFVNDELNRVITMHRWLDPGAQDVLIVANLQEMSRSGYRVGFPAAGVWRERFNSDVYEQYPNPQPVGNGGSVLADESGWNGMQASALVNLPANGFIVFVR